VPGSAVQVGRLAEQRDGQRPMRGAALFRQRTVVDGRAHQRVPEGQRRTILDDEIGKLAGRVRFGTSRKERLGAPYRVQPPGTARGDQQEQALRGGIALLRPPEEGPLESGGQRKRLAGSGRAQGRGGQLADGQRVPAGRPEQLGPVSLGQLVAGGEQRPGRVPVQAGQRKVDQPGRVQRPPLVGPGGQYQRDRLGVQPPRHERQRGKRRPVRPVRVVDQAQYRPVAGRLGQQRQGRERDQEAVRYRPGGLPEHHTEPARLGFGQPVDPVQYRQQQPVQRGVAEVGLRFDTGRPEHPEPGGALGRVPQQGGLANARLTPQDDAAPLPGPYPGQQRIERGPLLHPPVQHPSKPTERADRRLRRFDRPRPRLTSNGRSGGHDE